MTSCWFGSTIRRCRNYEVDCSPALAAWDSCGRGGRARMVASGAGGQIDGEPAGFIAPALRRDEAGGGEQVFHFGEAEFVAVFGVDGFALVECDFEIEGGNPDPLGGEAFEVHFDAGVDGIPANPVAEAVGIEIGAQFPV